MPDTIVNLWWKYREKSLQASGKDGWTRAITKLESEEHRCPCIECNWSKGQGVIASAPEIEKVPGRWHECWAVFGRAQRSWAHCSFGNGRVQRRWWPLGLVTWSHCDQVTCITHSAAGILPGNCALNVLLNLQEMLFIFSWKMWPTRVH